MNFIYMSVATMCLLCMFVGKAEEKTNQISKERTSVFQEYSKIFNITFPKEAELLGYEKYLGIDKLVYIKIRLSRKEINKFKEGIINADFSQRVPLIAKGSVLKWWDIESKKQLEYSQVRLDDGKYLEVFIAFDDQQYIDIYIKYF